MKIIDIIINIDGLRLKDGESIDDLDKFINDHFDIAYDVMYEVTYEEIVDD